MTPHQHQKKTQRPGAIYIYHWLVEDRPYMTLYSFLMVDSMIHHS
jgi:hypothetical protein